MGSTPFFGCIFFSHLLPYQEESPFFIYFAYISDRFLIIPNQEPVFFSPTNILLIRGHARYRVIRKKLASWDEEGVLRELTSAIGTLEHEEKEKQLEALVRRIEEIPGCLRDYRVWLKEKGIDTTNMRAMGSAEGTMHVFAKRSKNGRSWRDAGIEAMLRAIVAIKDTLLIRTRDGVMYGAEEREETKRETIVKKALKRVQTQMTEVVRDNIPYLRQSSGTPIYEALQALKGF
ncbi:UPF0236 family transposase-like protein [Anoxybacillus flavithermus]|uniref:UPF0236 family transposase-like protein n=1 Tax=Anoxybacillus flavithermus TaxID=33934 RepID=UPI001F509097|nr:UPF0236 family protein [Anoxybacillus flavithermus]